MKLCYPDLFVHVRDMVVHVVQDWDLMLGLLLAHFESQSSTQRRVDMF